VADGTLPLVFRSDFYPIFFMIAFAFSNGYVASASMILGASVAERHLPPEDASLAGTLMIFCLTLGLCLGAVASFATAYISS
jgi:solute carrier family 29 (equilibrative nucleoside transporter), member 1/2/3